MIWKVVNETPHSPLGDHLHPHLNERKSLPLLEAKEAMTNTEILEISPKKGIKNCVASHLTKARIYRDVRHNHTGLSLGFPKGRAVTENSEMVHPIVLEV